MRFSTSSLIASSLCILAVAASPHPSVAPRTPASPSAVPQALKARSPQPSPTVAKRTVPSSYAQRRKKREMQDQETLESLRFCPAGTNVCPIFSSDIASEERTLKNLTAYECVSFEEDLTSCGGCSSLDKRHDCTAISGALSVSCDMGACRVHKCAQGSAVGPDGRSCVQS